MAGIVMMGFTLELGSERPLAMTIAGSIVDQREVQDIYALVASYAQGVKVARTKQMEGGHGPRLQ